MTSPWSAASFRRVLAALRCWWARREGTQSFWRQMQHKALPLGLVGRKGKWINQGWGKFQVCHSFKNLEWKICFNFKGIKILLSQLANAWIIKHDQMYKNFDLLMWTLTWVSLINAILGLALLFFLLVLEKQKLRCEAFSVNKCRN